MKKILFLDFDGVLVTDRYQMQLLDARRLPGKVIGVTPNIDPIHRGNEIDAWLDANPGAVRYAIIDDCPFQEFFREEQLPHLFKVDERTGLDEETAKEIIEYLQK